MTLVLYRLQDGVAEIRFNRPDRLNAIDVPLAQAFLDAVKQAVADPAARAILLTGEGRAFMAGGDIAAVRNAPDAARELRAIIEPMHAAILLAAESPLPVVAAVQGAVAGAGMSLALMADLAIAADNARFNFAYLAIAGSPDCGGSWALAHLVGLRKAMEIALLGEPMDAQQALALGLVNRVVAPEDLETAGRALATRLANGPSAAIARTKTLLRGAQAASLETQLRAEAEAFVSLAGRADFREALDAFFEKRAPRFTGA